MQQSGKIINLLNIKMVTEKEPWDSWLEKEMEEATEKLRKSSGLGKEEFEKLMKEAEVKENLSARLARSKREQRIKEAPR